MPQVPYFFALLDMFANVPEADAPLDWDAWFEWTEDEERLHLAWTDRVAKTQDPNPLNDEP